MSAWEKVANSPNSVQKAIETLTRRMQRVVDADGYWIGYSNAEAEANKVHLNSGVFKTNQRPWKRFNFYPFHTSTYPWKMDGKWQFKKNPVVFDLQLQDKKVMDAILFGVENHDSHSELYDSYESSSSNDDGNYFSEEYEKNGNKVEKVPTTKENNKELSPRSKYHVISSNIPILDTAEIESLFKCEYTTSVSSHLHSPNHNVETSITLDSKKKDLKHPFEIESHVAKFPTLPPTDTTEIESLLQLRNILHDSERLSRSFKNQNDIVIEPTIRDIKNPLDRDGFVKSCPNILIVDTKELESLLETREILKYFLVRYPNNEEKMVIHFDCDDEDEKYSDEQCMTSSSNVPQLDTEEVQSLIESEKVSEILDLPSQNQKENSVFFFTAKKQENKDNPGKKFNFSRYNSMLELLN